MKLRITNPTAQVWWAFACEYWPALAVAIVLLVLTATALDAPY